MSGLDGRFGLVIGACSPVGRAAVVALVRDGATVLAVDVSPGEIDLAGIDGDVHAVGVDLGSTAAIDALVADAVARFGRPHLACNVADAVAPEGLLHELAEDDLDRLLARNVTTVFACMRAELRQLAQAGDGVIVNVASSNGIIGSAGRAAHSASMHAVLGLTRTAALEYGPVGIRVNAVCPGVVSPTGGTEDTDPGDTPLRRPARPEEVAEAIAWLCSDRASFVTGEAMQVDGGLAETDGQLH